jgi:hypothetical protein
MRRTGRFWLVVGFAMSLWSSCTTSDEVFEAAHVETSFQLTGPPAMNGSLSIDEAYLKLSHIDVNGSRQGKNITTLTHQIPADEPPYRLSNADSNQVSFDLPSRTYDALHFDLFLFQDTYELIITNDGPVDQPPVEEPDGNDDNEDGDQDGGNGTSGNDNDADNEGDDGSGDDDNDSGGDDSDKDDDDNDSDEDGDDDSGEDDDDDDSDEGDDNDGDSEDDDGDSDGEGKGKNDDNKGKNNDDKNKGKNDKGNKGDDDDDDDDDGGRVFKNQSVDIDHFFQNARPGLVVTGTYQANGKILKLIFVVDDLASIRLTGRQNDSPAITLQKQNRADVLVNPAKLFEAITDSHLASSAIQTYQGLQIIFIHRDFNTPLFDALISKLEVAAELNLIALADEPGI